MSNVMVLTVMGIPDGAAPRFLANAKYAWGRTHSYRMCTYLDIRVTTRGTQGLQTPTKHSMSVCEEMERGD